MSRATRSIVYWIILSPLVTEKGTHQSNHPQQNAYSFQVNLWANKAEIKQQIKVLTSDIRQKLGEMASVYARDGYAKAANSQSSFRDTISDEIDQVNALQTKLGVAQTTPIQWTPYYPYYVYNFMYW